MMPFSEAITKALAGYADFTGRSQRSEYWFWNLAVSLSFLLTCVIFVASPVVGAVLLLALLAGTFLPSLAVSVRRMHDIDRSGASLLFNLIPLVGGLILLVFTCTEGTPGPNRYGPSPRVTLDRDERPGSPSTALPLVEVPVEVPLDPSWARHCVWSSCTKMNQGTNEMRCDACGWATQLKPS